MRYGTLFLILLSFGCGEPEKYIAPPKSSFAGSFPKRNIQLPKHLGNAITVKRGNDTITFNFYANADSNVISSSRDGVIFTGKATRSWFDYYLNEKVNDSTYRIGIIRIKDNLIWGLQDPLEQMFFLDSLSKNKNFAPMIVRSNENEIRWKNSSKKDMRKLYENVLAYLVPDTIIGTSGTISPGADTLAVDAMEDEDPGMLSRIYPNPVRDKLTVELAAKMNLHYEISDANGKILRSGKLYEQTTELDVASLPAGNYQLVLTDDSKKVESLTFIKSK